MSAMEQLNYVYKYYKINHVKNLSLADLYVITLHPKALGCANDYGFFSQYNDTAGLYAANRGLDFNGDGQITKIDLKNKLDQRLQQYLQN